MRHMLNIFIALSSGCLISTKCDYDACLSQMHANPVDSEATILSLSQSPQPYQACKYILGEHNCF